MKRMWMLLLLVAVTSPAYAQDKPNIVLVLMDNLGYQVDTSRAADRGVIDS